MTDGDLSHLLGDDDEDENPRRRRGRPTREESKAMLAEKLKAPMPHYSEFTKPVGVTFLANICRKQPKQIQKRLEKCPVVAWKTHGGKEQPLYDFMTAVAYLVPPKGDIEDWFSQQNAATLPPYVNKMFWDSAHQRNRVMLSSGDLWHTDDVIFVLSNVEMNIRQEVKMWIEDLPEKELLKNEQYNALRDATTRLVDDIRKKLVEMPGSTLSMTDHIKSELDASGRIPKDEDRAAEDDYE